MYQTILLERSGRHAVLTLNRPQSMNAMDDVMMGELADAFESLAADTDVQVLVIKGAGRSFSAGGDIKKMADPDTPMDMAEVMGAITRLSKALYLLPQITIAAVHGAAAGLGFTLALACDILIAEEDSKLAMNFIGIGLVPDGGGHFFLKERIGTVNAKKLIWAGDVLDAKTANAAGLADELVPPGQASAAAEQFSAKLLEAPMASMMATKAILHRTKADELSAILDAEAESQIVMRRTEDHQEGIRAFLEKRRPVFRGK